ncbi:MAG: DNRLRE domain-containing protein [bacterium]
MSTDTDPLTPCARLVDLGPQRRALHLYAWPRFYRSPEGRWAETREAFRLADGDAVAEQGVHHLRARADGLCLSTHQRETIAFSLGHLVALDAEGRRRDLADVDLSTWTFNTSRLDRGVVAWDGPWGLRYEVRYTADQVRDRLILTDDARKAIGDRLPAGASRFGLGFEASLPTGEHDTERPIRLTGDGYRARLTPARVPDPRDPRRAAGWRERWRYRDGILLQTLPVEALDAAPELRTTVTYQQGVDSYSGCEDNYLEEGTYHNYGAEEELLTGQISSVVQRPILRFDISDIPAGATIDSATLELMCFGEGTPITVRAYMILKDWNEGDNGWKEADESEWYYGIYDTLAWSGCEPDDTDAESTEQDNYVVGGTGWHDWDLADACQDWVDGTDNHGVVLVGDPEDTNWRRAEYRSKEYGTTSERPKLTVEYTEGGGGGAAFDGRGLARAMPRAMPRGMG